MPADDIEQIAQPTRAILAFRASLRDQQRPSIAGTHLVQQAARRPIRGVAQRYGGSVAIPLIVAIEVKSDDVEVILAATQLRTETAGKHIEDLELREAVRLGGPAVVRRAGRRDDVNQRLRLNEPGAGVDPSHGRRAGDRRTHQLSLQRSAAVPCHRIHDGVIAARPDPKRDLIDWTIERRSVGLLTYHTRGRGGEISEARDEVG